MTAQPFSQYNDLRANFFEQDFIQAKTLRYIDHVNVWIDDQQVEVFLDPTRGPSLGSENSESLVTNSRTLWPMMPRMEQELAIIQAAKMILKNQQRRYTLEDEKLPEKTEEEIAAEIAIREQREAARAQRLAEEEAAAFERVRTGIETRCKAELARPPIAWSTITNDDVTAGHNRVAKGMFYDLDFPWSEETLIEFGPSWLTKAFHKAGTLEPDNKVTSIIPEKKVKVTTGNNGGKFLFEVNYKMKTPGLHTKLFAKVPFPLEGVTKSDRLSSSVNKQPQEFYELNTHRLLEDKLLKTLKTPKFYFGDISNETSNWILITERINFAERDSMNFGRPKKRRPALPPFMVEGPYDKCLDHNLRGPPREYYTLLLQTGAKIAGLHKAGALGKEELLKVSFQYAIDKDMSHWGVFPAGASHLDPRQFKAQLDLAVSFISDTGKVLFPAYTADETFLEKFRITMLTMNAYRGELNFWKHSNVDYIAITHQNMNVDNAYFWRKPDGRLDIGVFDWGGMGAFSLGHKLWWWLYCSEFEFFTKNVHTLLDKFIETYEEWGGPRLDKDVLYRSVILTALDQMIGLIAAVPQIMKMCPKKEWPTIRDRYDPRIGANVDGKSTLRLYLHVINNVVRIIEELGADQVLEEWIAGFYEKHMPRKSPEILGLA